MLSFDSPIEKIISSILNLSSSENKTGIFPSSFLAGIITVFLYLLTSVLWFLKTIYFTIPKLYFENINSNSELMTDKNPNNLKGIICFVWELIKSRPAALAKLTTSEFSL